MNFTRYIDTRTTHCSRNIRLVQLTFCLEAETGVVYLDMLTVDAGAAMQLAMTRIPIVLHITHRLEVTVTSIQSEAYADIIVTHTPSPAVGVHLAHGCKERHLIQERR